jgi:hypothetical protein
MSAADSADARTPAHWATGSTLQQRLDGPVDIVWAETPLRRAIRGLSLAEGVAILIDRRVDPDQKLDAQFSATPLRAALQEVAESRGLGVSLFGPLVYLGPPEAAARLRTISALRDADVRRLPATAAEKFQRMKPLAWDDLATPRDLLKEIAQQGGLGIAGLELVPHDLWAAGDLPPLSLADRLTLVAAEFDLTFDIDAAGTAVRLTPLPKRVAIVRDYPGGGDAEATAQRFAALAPHAEIKVAHGRVYVRGTIEDHELITQPQQAAATPKPSPSPAHERLSLKRFTLTVTKKPVGPLLEQLARQLKLELAVDKEAIDKAGISLDQRVSFSVKEATVDELFHAVVKPAGLKARRHGNVVDIGPAKQ